MKILLIVPNSKDTIRSIPLGLLYIAASLREKGSHHVIKIIDARHEGLNYEDVYKRIKDFSPEVVGISGLSIEAGDVHKISSLAKEVDTRCKVVIGGPYTFTGTEFIINDPNIDFVIMGEGERTVYELINALENGGGFSRIDGLAFKDGNTPVINVPRTMIEDADSITFPAWDLIDMEGYFNDMHIHSTSQIHLSNRIAPIFTSRGCPFRCIYCNNIFGKRIRLRSVQNVVKEIELLVKQYNVGQIEIIDDCFNFDISRAKQICDEIVKRGININLSFPALRVDKMDKELIVKLKRAGTHLIYYGIESGSSRIQARIKKNLDLEKARQIIRQTVGQGIMTGGFFMLGFLEETKEEMLQTIKFAKETDLHIASFFYVTPMPNTELSREYEQQNLRPKELKLRNYQKLSVNISPISDRELRRMRRKAYAEFYLRPSQLWRLYKAIPDKRILLRHAFFVLWHSITA